MRILIMVLSYNMPPFDQLMLAQQDSWDSINVAGVMTMYYHGGKYPNGSIDFALRHSNPNSTWERMEFDCTDEYYLMASKFKKALNHAIGYGYEFDIIFRTNSSSYVNKQKLIEFAHTLPKEKLYAGWTVTDSEDFGGACVSGAGIFLSRDCAEILMNEIDPKKEIEEDVYIGRILRRNGVVAIDDKSRIDYPQTYSGEDPGELRRAYHIRFKTNDRYQDANNMRYVHNEIILKNV